MIHLANDYWSLDIEPDRGASVVSCACLGSAVLAPARPAYTAEGNVFAASCFPLIPFSNRIADGMFSFAGQTYQIKRNHPDEAHPNHGNGWEKPWAVVEHEKSYCVLSLDYSPKAGSWPWAYRATLSVHLSGQKLVFTLSLHNSSSEPCPAGIGLHPAFARPQTAYVQFESDTLWESDENNLPTHSCPTPDVFNFTEARTIGGMHLDNCFSGWPGWANISWEDQPGHINMQASAIFSHMVVYAQAENSFFCLEPTSHINNALNMDKGMHILNPGDEISGTVALEYHHP